MKNEILLITLVVCGFLQVCNTNLSAQTKNTPAEDAIIGLYFVYEESTKEESKISIQKDADGTYYAQVAWMKQPNMPDGSPKKDFKNPNVAMREVHADRIVIMRGLSYNPSKKEWENGKVYNPLNGKTYKSYMEFVAENKLKVRGYLGISMLGKTMYWTKIK